MESVDNPLHAGKKNVTTRKRHKKPSVEEAARVRLLLSPSFIPAGGTPKDRRLYPCCATTGRFCFKSVQCCDPFCEGRVSSFLGLGSGPSSFFKNFKLLIVAFFLMSCFAMPALVINTFNAGSSASGSLSLADTTFAGLASSSGSVRLPIPVSSQPLELTRDTLAMIYSLCDLGGSLVFLLVYLWARSFTKREEKQVDKLTITADDYTVFIPWVPRDTTEEHLVAHFTHITTTELTPEGLKIAEVHVVEDSTAMVGLFVDRGRVFRQIERLQERIGRLEEQVRMGNLGCTLCFGGVPGSLSRLKTFRELLAQRAETLSHKATLRASKGSVAAFVTFEEESTADFVLSKYPDSFASWCCQPRKYRLYRGGSEYNSARIQVLPAPPPASILWPNLAVGACEQRTRQGLTGLLTAIFLLGSFLLLWFASWKHDQYVSAQSVSVCASDSVLSRLSAGTLNRTSIAGLTSTHQDVYCYCGSLPWPSYSASSIEADAGGWSTLCSTFACPAYLSKNPGGIASLPFCYEFIQGRAVNIALTVAASVAVLFINSFLAVIMRVLTSVEAHKSFEDLNASLQLRLFFAQFFNTSLLMILVNVAWPGTTSIPEEFKTGKWSDLTGGWYGSVGVQIMVTMMINVVTPHLYPLVMAVMYWRTIRLPNQDAPSQRDLNDRFVGPYADWSLRYAQLANVMAVCFAFSTGMPLLLPIAFVSFLLGYWVDKVLFLWYFRKPPSFGSSVQRSFVQLMPMALILHLAWGSWAISYGPLLNWSGFDPLRVQKYVGMASRMMDAAAPGIVAEGAARLTKLQSLPLFVMFMVMVAAMVVHVIFSGTALVIKGAFNFITCGACANRTFTFEKDENSKQPLYSEACDPTNAGKAGCMQGLPSYNLLLNPEIMSAFAISPEWAASHKTLSEVALYQIGNASMRNLKVGGGGTPLAKGASGLNSTLMPAKGQGTSDAVVAMGPSASPAASGPTQQEQAFSQGYGYSGSYGETEYEEEWAVGEGGSGEGDVEEEYEYEDDQEVGGFMAGVAPAYTASTRRLGLPPPFSRAGAGKAPSVDFLTARRRANQLSRQSREPAGAAVEPEEMAIAPATGLSRVQKAAEDMEAAIARSMGFSPLLGQAGQPVPSEAQIATTSAAVLIVLRHQLGLMPPESTQAVELSRAVDHLSTFVTLEARALSPVSSTDPAAFSFDRTAAGSKSAAQATRGVAQASPSSRHLAGSVQTSLWARRTSAAARSPGAGSATSPGGGARAGATDAPSSPLGSASSSAGVGDVEVWQAAWRADESSRMLQLSLDSPRPAFAASAATPTPSARNPTLSMALPDRDSRILAGEMALEGEGEGEGEVVVVQVPRSICADGEDDGTAV